MGAESWAKAKTSGSFDEDLHPRDENGRWAPSKGTSAAKDPSGGKGAALEQAWNKDEDDDVAFGFANAGKELSSLKVPGYGAKNNPNKVAARIAGPLAARAAAQGGFSFRPGEKSPKTGFMVSVPTKEGMNQVIDVHEMAGRDPPPTEKELRAEISGRVRGWLDGVLPKVMSKDEHYLGGWMQKDEKGAPMALHLDVSQRFTDKDKAVSAGKERNQLAIWHLDKGEEISTGGTGK